MGWDRKEYNHRDKSYWKVVRIGDVWDDGKILEGGKVLAVEGYSLWVENNGAMYLYDIGGYEFEADILEMERADES